MENKHIVGHLEVIDLLDLDILNVIARVDSGAQISAIWASFIKETTKGLEVVFFGKSSAYFNGQKIILPYFRFANIKNSTGEIEKRYKVLLRVKIHNHVMKKWFTLADRSKQKYPILIGRNILKDKFLVDVSLELNNQGS